MIILAGPSQRELAKRQIDEAPDGYVVRIEEPRRNLEQNAKLHALLSEIARRREWIGKKWDAEAWKRLFVAAWSRAANEHGTIVPALDGHGIDIIYRRTSKLTKRECAELIDYIEAWDAQH